MANNFKLMFGDIVIGRGMERVSGIEYTTQLVRNNLLTFFSEWDLDESIGIDWYNIMGTNYDLSIIQGLVTQVILETKGVFSIERVILDVNKKTRILSISFTGIGDGTISIDIQI